MNAVLVTVASLPQSGLATGTGICGKSSYLMMVYYRRNCAATTSHATPHPTIPARRNPCRRQPGRSRQEPADPPGPVLPARQGAPAYRRPARRRQDDAGAYPGSPARFPVLTRPVHQRHAAGGHPRRFGFRPRARRLPLPARPGLRAGPARRRNQPRDAEDAERAARSHGRGTGDHRGRNAPPAATVLRHRHAEPVEPDWHLPPARIATRSLPHAHRTRLPGPCCSKAAVVASSCRR